VKIQQKIIFFLLQIFEFPDFFHRDFFSFRFFYVASGPPSFTIHLGASNTPSTNIRDALSCLKNVYISGSTPPMMHICCTQWRNHQSQRALLVPDEKLDRFASREKNRWCLKHSGFLSRTCIATW